ncbi:MAG: hypothetical protein IIZ06_03800 [Kiritimatiellae bacterium]|nr:hypothetical protein [Kiritimatiellia bacterium]
MTIPLKNWMRGSPIRAADLNRMVEAIRRATPVAGNGISVSQSLGGSVISLSGKAGAGGAAEADGVDFPFKIKRVNSGTLESHAWHTIVYVPEDAITITTQNGVTYIRDADSTSGYPGMADWYEYTRNDGFGAIVLQLALYLDRVTEPQTYKCYWRLAKQGDGLDAWNPQAQGQYGRGKFEIPIGEVSGTGGGDVYNLVRSSVYAARVSFYSSGGGGGGSVVEVDDQRTDATDAGVVGYGGVAADGSIVLVVTDGIGIDNVAVDSSGHTLLDYISGDVEVAGGTNVNTENFADECLGDPEVPDVGDEPDGGNIAAPWAHVHKLSQFVNEDGEPVTGEDMASFFEGIGMWDSLGETGPSGEGPSADSLLTVGDILTNDVMVAGELKPDSENPSAGDPSTDLLVLSGHSHPLNVADMIMATGPSGATPSPPASDYVLPVGVGTTGPSGVASPSSAEFGVQPFYARVDHIHPICDDMGPTGLVTTGDVGPSGGMAMPWADQGDFGPTGAPTGVTLDQHTWTPGEQGYEESYCTRVVRVVGSAVTTRYAIFRRRKVSRTGAVVWVGPEYVGFRMLASSN